VDGSKYFDTSSYIPLASMVKIRVQIKVEDQVARYHCAGAVRSHILCLGKAFEKTSRGVIPLGCIKISQNTRRRNKSCSLERQRKKYKLKVQTTQVCSIRLASAILR
jgi:hypothetical protein